MWKIGYTVFFCALTFETSSCSAPIWTSYQFGTGYGNREELVIYEMVANDSLKVDLQVSRWKSITVEATNYAVGITDTGLAVLKTWMTPQGEIKIESEVHDLPHPAVDISLFSTWNRISKTQDILAVVATNGNDPEVSWYRVDGTGLGKFWSWHLHKNVTHINRFTTSYDSNYLLVIGETKNANSVDIYLYDLEGKSPEFWLSQTLPLESSANTSAISSFGSDSFLSIPQRATNTLLLFRDHVTHFEPYETIHSQGVSDVIAFRNGFKSYIAVDGLDAAIYQITEDGVVRESIQEYDLHDVEYWLNVPTLSYRDDSVLLAQRVLDYGSHRSATIDMVVPDGGTFVEQEDVACDYFGESKTTMGSCLIEHNEYGVKGSAGLYFGDSVLGLLVPHRDRHSLVFVMKTAFKKVEGPVALERKLILDARKRIEAIISTYENELLKMQKEMQMPSPVEIVGKTLDQKPSSQASRAGKHHIFNSTIRSGDIEVDEDEELSELLGDISVTKNNISKLKVQVDDLMERIEKQEHFKTIIFDGSVKFLNEVNVSETEVETIGDEPVEQLLQDIVRQNHMGKITGNKTFHQIEIEGLDIEQLNNFSAEAIVFKTQEKLSLDGGAIFQGKVHVKGDVEVTDNSMNDISLGEIVDMTKPIKDKLHFDHVKIADQFHVAVMNDILLPTEDFRPDKFLAPHLSLEEFYVPQNVTVDKINGMDFSEFLKSIRLKNENSHFPGHINVVGEISTEDLHLENLNGIQFPEEYFINGSHISKVVTGFKKFKNLLVDGLRTNGFINGIHTDSIMTLSDNQTILGNMTFQNLEVTTGLNYTKKLYSDGDEGFIRNPSIEESDTIRSNVNFKHLQIDGPIVLMNNFGDTDFELKLKDIIYKDEAHPTITGVKHIVEGTSIRKNLVVLSNAINSVPLKNIVTKDTEQDLDITHLDGIVSFDKLEVGGLYGGTNVTALDQTTVKLTGQQFISSSLIFTGESPEMDVLEITDRINDLPIQEFVDKKSKQLSLEQLEFDTFEASEILVEGDFQGKLDGFDIDEFARRKLSLGDSQQIEKEYSAAKCVFDTLEVESVRDQYTGRKVLTEADIFQEIQRLLRSGTLRIQNLNVNGSVVSDKINGVPFENPRRVWRTNVTVPEELVIRGDVYFDKMQIEQLANKNFRNFIESIVFKNQTDLLLDCDKTLTHGLTVQNLITTNKLNDIQLEDVLRKQPNQTINGPIEVHGDVTFDCHVTIEDSIDNVPMTDVHGRYDDSIGGYVIKDNITFKRVPHIEHLMLRGFVDGKNVTEHLEKLVYLDRNNTFTGKVVFHDKVNIKGDIDINGNFNGINFQDFVSQAASKDINDTIEGPVKFKHPVYVLNSVTVLGDLVARTVYGIDTKVWEEEAIYVDRGKLPGKYTFDSININGELTTEFLNSMNTDGVIPLRSDENLEKLEIGRMVIANDISVAGLVNGVNLHEEFNNTVMMDEYQEVSAPVVFANNVTIKNDLYVVGKLNGRDLNKAVTATTDQTLSANYHFSTKVTMESNLVVTDLVNGFNVSVWPQEIIRIYSPHKQVVNDSWTVQGDMTFMDDVDGGALINGMSLKEIASSVDRKRAEMYEIEEQLRADVKTICNDLKNIHRAASDQIYKFKYFDYLPSIELEIPIGIVHDFEHDEHHYILVSERGGCNSSLLVLDGNRFYPVMKAVMGQLLQIITVKGDGVLYLVTRSENVEACGLENTNVWRFNGTNIELIRILDRQKLLHDSLIPDTFYGMDKEGVTEFKMITKYDSAVKKYRAWRVNEANTAFVPRGLRTGLALRTGKELIRLIREDPVVEPDLDETEGESVIVGHISRKFNDVLPGKGDGDLAAVDVGKEYARTMLAVASHEETSVRGRLDFIKIYEDVYSGRLFHKIPTFRPSSLVSISFGNGETLLVFLEDKSTLQVYEYKGVEGFKKRTSIQMKAHHLFSMQLPGQNSGNKQHVIGVVDDRSITFVKAIMAGNKIEEEFTCDAEV